MEFTRRGFLSGILAAGALAAAGCAINSNGRPVDPDTEQGEDINPGSSDSGIDTGIDMKNNDVRIIGALEDEIIPINLLREIVSNKKIFPNNVTFDEIKSDHNFTYSKADLESWLLHNV